MMLLPQQARMERFARQRRPVPRTSRTSVRFVVVLFLAFFCLWFPFFFWNVLSGSMGQRQRILALIAFALAALVVMVVGIYAACGRLCRDRMLTRRALFVRLQ